MAKRRFILRHMRSPGDLVCLTALMRDIHLTYPGVFETDFSTTVPDIWDNNPYVTRLWNHDHKAPVLSPDATLVDCQYGDGLRAQNHETVHFCTWFHRDFEKQTGIPVKVHYPHGDLHLSEEEKAVSPVIGRYWLLLSGGKSDFTIKVWRTSYFQEVVDRLNDAGLGIAQRGSTEKGHWHPQLHSDNMVDLVGWGGTREFLQAIYHAEGVICGVTAAMHIAAAFHKPCVVIAGGREAWWWEAYVRENRGLGEARHLLRVPHRFLHTIGRLDCCRNHGCWRNKVVAIPGSKDKSFCKRPIHYPDMPIAECMDMITPDMVVNAVMSYYYDGTLPPVDDDSPVTLDTLGLWGRGET